MKFTGVIPALITPLNQEKNVNVPALRQLLETLLEQGADGFYIGGATGEGICLNRENRMVLCEEAIKAVQGRVPCIVHIAATDFSEAVWLARHAQRSGADAVSAIPPLFYSYTASDIFQYYKMLAAAVDIPLIIYNNPGSGVRFTPEQIAELFKIQNITGVKWTSPDYYSVIRIRDLTSCKMNIINGPDETFAIGLACGMDAGIGTTYNIMLPLFRKIQAAFLAGDAAKALEYQTLADRVIHMLLSHSLIPAVKAVMEGQGIPAGDAVHPFPQYSRKKKEEIYRQFQDLYRL